MEEGKRVGRWTLVGFFLVESVNARGCDNGRCHRRSCPHLCHVGCIVSGCASGLDDPPAQGNHSARFAAEVGESGEMHGAWCMVHGAWCRVHGAWCVMHVAKGTVQRCIE